MSSPRFSALGVSEPVCAVLTARGVTEAFPIQALTIPPALAGADICGRAPTGSGKTLAFGVPLVERVAKAEPRRPRALVLVPTRELAAQIHDELTPLLATRKRRVASFYGGVGFGAQLASLRRGVDVAVACPGRLADLVQRGEMHLDAVEIVVLDEADRMADMGFLPEVRRLLDRVRPDRQTLLYSATLDGEIDVLVRRYQRNPTHVDVTPEADDQPDRTTHEFRRTAREARVREAAGLIEVHGPTVVFCRTKHGVDRVARQLRNTGVRTAAIHGGRSQGQRDRALASFAQGQVEALVATDVAARGIHVDDVACVVHFDLPADPKDYVHRSGRTGRAGATGVVVSLVTDADAAAVGAITRALDLPREHFASAPTTASERSGGRGGSHSDRNGASRRRRSRSNGPRAGQGAGAGAGSGSGGRRSGGSGGSAGTRRRRSR